MTVPFAAMTAMPVIAETIESSFGVGSAHNTTANNSLALLLLALVTGTAALAVAFIYGLLRWHGSRQDPALDELWEDTRPTAPADDDRPQTRHRRPREPRTPWERPANWWKPEAREL